MSHFDGLANSVRTSGRRTLRLAAAAAIALGLTDVVSAGPPTVTWIGSMGNWGDAANWDFGGMVPFSTHVIIPGPLHSVHTNEYNANNWSFTLASGCELFVDGGSVSFVTIDLLNDGEIFVTGALFDVVGSHMGTNHGTMEATAGGHLRFVNSDIDNSTGVITAKAGGRVQLAGTTIHGGRLVAENLGIIEVEDYAYSGATFDTVSVTGDVYVRVSDTLILTGPTFTQSGTTFVDGSAVMQCDLTGSGITMQGDGEMQPGEIELGDSIGNDGAPLASSDPANSDPANVVTVASDFTIRGGGGISVPLRNEGLIRADNPVEILLLSSTPKTNFGLIEAVADSTLSINAIEVENRSDSGKSLGPGIIRATGGTIVLTDASIPQDDDAQIIAEDGGVIDMRHSLITGGTIDTTNGGLTAVTKSGSLDDVTNAGRLVVGPSISGLSVSNTITNNGTIVIRDPGGFNANNITRVGDVTFGGTGKVVLDAMSGGSILNAFFNADVPESLLTNEAGHTLAGRGALYGDYLNQGIFSPGDLDETESDIGEFLLQSGAFQCDTSSVVNIQLSGTGTGQFDKISCSNTTFACDGTLLIEHLDGYNGPACGEFVDIITTLPGDLTGEFANVVAPELDGGNVYRLQYLTDRVRLIALPECPTDVNNSGDTGFADLTATLLEWGLCSGCATDTNDDGMVSFVDLTLLLNNWGPCPDTCP